MELFDSLTDPIPPLRYDIEAFPVEDGSEQMIVLRDPGGYATDMLVFKQAAWSLFLLFDGIRSVAELRQEIFRETGHLIANEQILTLAQTLDRGRFLNSGSFQEYRRHVDDQFRKASVRPAAHAGQSYPAGREEAVAFLDELFDRSKKPVPSDPPVGIIVPHIDLRVGGETYVPAFRALRHADADTFIVLGTSHYSDEDLLMLTEKDFDTPLGVMETDKEFIREFRGFCSIPLTENDIAHRQEHSIEFPVLFLKYLYPSADTKIVPILCSSFHQFLSERMDPMQSDRFASSVRALRLAAERLGRNVIYVLSVDWSHVGIKFGDDRPAAQLLEKTKVSDLEQLKAVTKPDYPRFFDLLASTQNETRIDAFACFSTFYYAIQPASGRLLEYEQWHEEERRSGVTFAAAAFYG